MKAHLMYRERDFDVEQKLPWNEGALTQDLELDTLFSAMALGDQFLFDVAKKVILWSPTNHVSTILYRQDILKDVLKNSATVRAIYDLAVEAIESERKNFWGILTNYPEVVLHRSMGVMQMFVGMLKRLWGIADQYAEEFASEGFRTLFAMLKEELSDEYFGRVQHHLKQLQFRRGVLISAGLGQGNKGINYVLRKPNDRNQNWLEWALGPKPAAHTFRIADRDDNGARALSELRDRGLNLVSDALAQSCDHILSFFNLLRAELAFYVGCLNLHEQLAQGDQPTCFPVPVDPRERAHTARGLYDACLALVRKRTVVGNDLNADNHSLVMIRGANQGGKSAFLRSIGLSQLMMQCGMFVPAEHLSANVCDGLFTHYKREEDASMNSGKLDEELSRMSEIADHVTPNSILLFNESFAATNEREGSEIARQIVSALLELRIKVFFVTHLYTLSQGLCRRQTEGALFLQAERQADGTRTYRILEGEPTETSYGVDLYNRIFGEGTVGDARRLGDTAGDSA